MLNPQARPFRSPPAPPPLPPFFHFYHQVYPRLPLPPPPPDFFGNPFHPRASYKSFPYYSYPPPFPFAPNNFHYNYQNMDGFSHGSKRFSGTKTRNSKKGYGRTGYYPRKDSLIRKWVPKNTDSSSVQTDQTHSQFSFDFNESEAERFGKTTLMIKNIPCKMSRKNLEDLLDKHCHYENNKEDSQSVSSGYDFVYLPFSFQTGLNLGYAFVNFTSVVGAVRFYKSYQGFGWKQYRSVKTCEIKYAKIQGKEALVCHFKKSFFLCDNEEFLPVVFSPPRIGSASPTYGTTYLGRR